MLAVAMSILLGVADDAWDDVAKGTADLEPPQPQVLIKEAPRGQGCPPRSVLRGQHCVCDAETECTGAACQTRHIHRRGTMTVASESQAGTTMALAYGFPLKCSDCVCSARMGSNDGTAAKSKTASNFRHAFDNHGPPANGKKAGLQGPFPFFLYTHLPKAGGTSFVIDLAKMRGARPCDRDLKCVHAERDYRVRPPNASAISKGACNLLGCEGHRDDIMAHALASVRRAPALRGTSAMVSATETISRAKDILLLRSPVDHVVSMYAHCQQAGGLGKRSGHKPSGVEGLRPDISLPAWLALWEAGNATEARKFCEYDPRNLQTARLSLNGSNYELDSNFVTLAPTEDDLAHASRRLHNAAIVGVLEEYPSFLCTVQFALDAAETTDASGSDHRRQKTKSLAAVAKCLKEAHTKGAAAAEVASFAHGTNTNVIAVDGSSRRAIARLTRLDLRLYSMALILHDSAVRDHLHRAFNGAMNLGRPLPSPGLRQGRLPCPAVGSIANAEQRVSVVLMMGLTAKGITECHDNKHVTQAQLAMTSVRRMSVVPITLVWSAPDVSGADIPMHACLVREFGQIPNVTLKRLWLPPAHSLLHVQHPMMLKLVLPWAMPFHDKILIIDLDAIVIRDVLPLFELPAPAGGASGNTAYKGPDPRPELAISDRNVNSGVLLLPAAGSAPAWANALLRVADEFGPQTCSDQEIWNAMLHNRLTSPHNVRSVRHQEHWDYRNCSDEHLVDHRWAGDLALLQSRILSSIDFCPENGHYALPEDVHIQGPWENVKTEWVDAIVTGKDLPNTPYILHKCCGGLPPQPAFALYAALRDALLKMAARRNSLDTSEFQR